MTPQEEQELKQSIRHTLGCCSFQPATEKCNHIPCRTEDEREIDALIALFKTQAAQVDIAARIDELGGVQLVHGRRLTQTFVNGKSMIIQARISDLERNRDKVTIADVVAPNPSPKADRAIQGAMERAAWDMEQRSTKQEQSIQSGMVNNQKKEVV